MKAKLQWRPQDVRGVRTSTHLLRKAVAAVVARPEAVGLPKLQGAQRIHPIIAPMPDVVLKGVTCALLGFSLICSDLFFIHHTHVSLL